MMRKMLLIVITVLGVQLDAGSAWSQQWGHLTARFVFDGEAPKRVPVVVNKDAAVCGKLKLLDEVARGESQEWWDRQRSGFPA